MVRMVSFEVKSLFTNVPIGDALDWIEDKILDDITTLTPDQVTLLLKICLETTYFVYTTSTMSRQMERHWLPSLSCGSEHHCGIC